MRGPSPDSNKQETSEFTSNLTIEMRKNDTELGQPIEPSAVS